MRFSVYALASTALVAAIAYQGYEARRQFYPTLIYLTTNKLSLLALGNEALMLTLLVGQLVKALFFGRLREAEVEHLYERSWYAITETCLAMTIFREEFNVALYHRLHAPPPLPPHLSTAPPPHRTPHTTTPQHSPTAKPHLPTFPSLQTPHPTHRCPPPSRPPPAHHLPALCAGEFRRALHGAALPQGLPLADAGAHRLHEQTMEQTPAVPLLTPTPNPTPTPTPAPTPNPPPPPNPDQDRIAYMEQTPAVPLLTHGRMLLLMALLFSLDAAFLYHAVHPQP